MEIASLEPTPDTASRRSLSPSGSRATVAVLIALAIAAWIETGVRMTGMDAGPGTDPGALGFYIVTWIVMMAAMMLPSAAPAVLAYRELHRPGASRGGDAVATVSFVAGYLALWGASGLLGYVALKEGRSLVGALFAWHRAGRWTAGSVLALAAAYELTPLKLACLARCRSLGSLRDAGSHAGPLAALCAGAGYGGWCLGCCAALMVALFALGAMSLVWMALVAALIAAQKLLPWASPSVFASALVLAALALGLALMPSSVPGLTVPGGPATMHAMGGHS